MPYAQSHYPFENKKQFEATFPADFIAEGIDQTRGWYVHSLKVYLMKSQYCIVKVICFSLLGNHTSIDWPSGKDLNAT